MWTKQVGTWMTAFSSMIVHSNLRWVVISPYIAIPDTALQPLTARQYLDIIATIRLTKFWTLLESETLFLDGPMGKTHTRWCCPVRCASRSATAWLSVRPLPFVHEFSCESALVCRARFFSLSSFCALYCSTCHQTNSPSLPHNFMYLVISLHLFDRFQR